MSDYFQSDAISATLLKTIVRRSPIHAIERMKSFVPPPTMKLGTAFHAATLEPDRYFDLISVMPNVDARTKAGKELRQKFHDELGDKTAITEEQQHAVEAMSLALHYHPYAKALIEKMEQREVEKFFDFEDLECKAKIDLLSKGVVVDIKTTINASPDSFRKQSANLLCHLQLAWYAKAAGYNWNECDAYIIAIENSPPYSVAVYQYEQRAMELGWDLCLRGIQLWKEHLAAKAIDGQSLAYGEGVMDLYLPAWAETFAPIE